MRKLPFPEINWSPPRQLAAGILLTATLVSQAAAPTIIDLGGFPSPARLTVEGGARQDQAGAAVAVGDLNHDSVTDLVISAPLADPAGRVNAGQVYIVYGGAGASGTIFLTDSYSGPRLQGAASLDQFGEAIAVGDFNGDSIDDLAVGASWVDHAGRTDSGATYVFKGMNGAFPSVDLSLQAPWLTIWGAATEDRAGIALAADDLNGDGRDELIIGSPRAGLAGRIYFIPGSATLAGQVDLATGIGSYMIEGQLPAGQLGSSLATGDIDADGKVDVLVGAPYASPNGRASAGVVYLIRGRSILTDINLVTQPADLTIFGAAAGDNLGTAVAVGDLDGDRLDDLAIGAAGARRSGAASAGSAYGLLWRPSLPAILDLAAADAELELQGISSYDKLGSAAVIDDLDGDPYLDFLAAAPNGDPPGRPQAGLIYGVSGFHVTAGSPPVQQSDLVIYGGNDGERAGAAIAVGDITGDTLPDLVIGAPRADSVMGTDAGRVYVVPGPLPLLPAPEPFLKVRYLPILLKQD